MSKRSSDGRGVARRRFLKTVPAAVAAGLAAPALAQQTADQAARISKDTLDCAEKISGIDFTDAEQQQALAGVNRSLTSFEQLRKVDIPLNTEPAITFRPYLPGKKPRGGATPNARLKVATNVPAARRSSIEDLAFLPVTSLAALVQKRDVSATDLTRMYLDRLKKYGPKLNCVVTLTEELALAQAAQADKEIRSGRYRGPLHGIPWGAKDLFATKGIVTTWGAAPYQNQMIDYDATIVERLRDAGAVLVAKLSLGALAQGDNWFRGQTKTPWNTERGSSGSSAGPGAATAGGLVGFSIGTETRGSIISPSAVNGVVGLRPTYGRVSRYGAMALSWTMDKIGPMCRGVEDCALVFNAIYGPDGRDDTVVDAPFAWNPDVPLSKLRIGYVKTEFEAQPQGRGRGDTPGGAGRGETAAAGRGEALDAAKARAWRRRRTRPRRPHARAAARPGRSAAEGAERCARRVPQGRRHAASGRDPRHAARQHDRLHPERRSRGGVRRPDAQRRHPRSVAQHLAQYLPDPPLRARRRVHPRAAGAHAADPRDGRVHEPVRRVPVLDQQRQPWPDQPHRTSGAGAPRRIPRDDAHRIDDYRTALRRGHGAAGGTGVRTRHRMALENADAFGNEAGCQFRQVAGVTS